MITARNPGYREPAGEPTGNAGVDIEEIVSQVTRRLRTEFRIDRERFGRLRDSTR